jgi:hypothetical protein
MSLILIGLILLQGCYDYSPIISSAWKLNQNHV